MPMIFPMILVPFSDVRSLDKRLHFPGEGAVQ